MYKKSVLLTAILSLIVLSACGGGPAPIPPDGEVVAITTQTTAYWIQECLKGSTGTYILQNANQDLVFIWSMKDQGFGFTMIANSGAPSSAGEWVRATGGQAQLANMKTAKELFKYLEQNGWKLAPSVGIPTLTRMLIVKTLADAVAVLTAAGGSLISIFVMPSGVEWEMPGDAEPVAIS